MRRKKILIFPTLKCRKGDLSKKWYVEISQRNPKTDEMLRKRFEVYQDININDLPSADERHELAKNLINELNEKLESGWTIFSDTELVVYEDQTQYAAEAVFFKKRIMSNKNYTYWNSRYIAEILRPKLLRTGTNITYESRYRVFKNWLIKNNYNDLDITGITNKIIVEFFTFLRDVKGHTNHTYSSYANLLTEFFYFVLKEKGMAKNPVFNLPVNRTVKDMGAEAFYKEDLKLIMERMDEVDPQLALACRFEYYCGLRPGIEIRFMKVGDLNLRKGVSKVKVSADNCKSTRRKEVAIPDVFLKYLLEVWRIDRYNSELYVFGRKRVPGDEHLGKNTLRGRFNRLRDELGLPDIYKLYSLKHTGAVTLAEQGETIINIRDHLGHTSIETTEKYLKRLGYQDSKIIRHNFPEI